MTTTELFATLRTQLQDANKPGLAGVRALEGAAQTVAALEDAVRLMEQRYARLQSEHSDLIEKERILEAQLAAERRRQNIPDMVIDGYVNYVIASKAIRIEAMPFHAWLAAGDRE